MTIKMMAMSLATLGSKYAKQLPEGQQHGLKASVAILSVTTASTRRRQATLHSSLLHVACLQGMVALAWHLQCLQLVVI